MDEIAAGAANPKIGRAPLKLAQVGCLVPLFFLVLALLTPLAWRRLVYWGHGRHIYTVEDAPAHPTAIVFGAAVYGNGRLSTVLRDRMDTAVELYHSGKVRKLLVSGDSVDDFYDEAGAMYDYAVSQGVSQGDIQIDHAGQRTYDTCYRAQSVFELDQAILVTQQFHLSRALFTCRSLGIEASGVAADRRPYRAARWYELRETAATFNALFDVIRRQPPPSVFEPASIS